MTHLALALSAPLILGIAIFAAAVVCFLLLVLAAMVVGHMQAQEEEIALDEEARKAGM